MIRVLIRASSAMVKAGLESILRAYPSLQLVSDSGDSFGEADDVDGVIADMEFDVVLAEVEGRDDENASLVLDDAASGAAVVLLVHGATTEWADTLRQGVKAVLPSNVSGAQIAAAIEAAVNGLIVLHPSEVESLVPSQRVNDFPEALPEALTPREIEVLRLLAEGFGNKEIAARLGISEHTVKFHVASVMGKLGAGSRTEAVTLGIRRGVVLI
jgi:DNA-binding NarL/FixJ family response regulator